MIQFEELRLQLLEDEDALKELSSALGLEEMRKEVATLEGSFLRLSRCLFNSKNERTCQEHPEKSGCVFS